MRYLLLCTGALAAAPLVGHAQTLFSDTFNNGASALWRNERGNWAASNGVYNAQPPNNNPPTLSSLPYVLGDLDLEVDVKQVSDGGVWVHIDDQAQNGVLLVTGGSGHTGTGFYWHVITNGSYSPPMNQSGSLFAQLDDIHIRISARGASYSVYLAGSTVPASTLTLPQPRTGNVGLYDFTSPGQSFDNFVLSVSCYANCDLSTAAPILNVNDFTCFLNRYAAGDSYANCDLSTAAPILNVNDFTCFLNRYAAGCQ